MKEDPIAVYARKLITELNRDGLNMIPEIKWLEDLTSTYESKPESRIADLERRMDALEKDFFTHVGNHKL